MAEILAFAGSNSSTSINYELVKYTVSLIDNHNVQTLDMSRYPFPMYSADEEKKKGFSNSLIEFKGYLQQSQGLILSVNEHNGNPSGYFKNLLDWLSRLERKFLEDTLVFLMSASTGKGGGKGALEVINTILPRFGAEIASTFSLPSFGETFAAGEISDAALREQHAAALQTFLQKLN
ncbi:NADPH-dependent FMN reductase [Flagellimonas meridianipacifica]|uniref:NAD(P)H-dependent FMN reductase n=1 Tax=Flagellimonas meridianipacifica TaxID=1080225 RepID=A0A2T0MBA3_9FLAO|nr:NAD(P)H-dependent oxidoreductase [Allomuricauda pacifica]PRX54692.1 NAD(P)H-dependent FMN reductase [Allomuricauda pacifica]